MPLRLFAAGFRPTFLAAGVAAALLVPTWALVWAFGLPLGSSWPPTMWHAHEMLFGFVAAAIAGLLLTAVPGWTGRQGFAGPPLVILMAVWLCGRILILSSARWPAALVLVVDVAFLVVLAALVAPPLLRARNRNTPLLLVLALLAACNVAFHVALVHQNPTAAYHAILIGIDISLLLVTIVGGRIIPAFTANALRSCGSTARVSARRGVSAAAIGAMVLVAIVDVFSMDSRVSGGLAAVAAIIQALRMLQWRTPATLRHPIVWVLHLGYAWLPLGLALKSMALLGEFALSAFWLHALTVGVLATMVLGVMSRAALGHTGRPLVVDPLISSAYVLLMMAGLVRVFGLEIPGVSYPTVILLSASCWTLAFWIFSCVYAPILWSARADGKAG